MNNEHSYLSATVLPQLLLALPFLIVLIGYLVAVFISNKCYKLWPVHRIILLVIGVLLAVVSVISPLADLARENFVYHMVGHLFLGMLAPLLIALAAPMTLLLRTLSVPMARKLTKILRSWPLRILNNPATASVLNIGGLWILYTTSLYTLMHHYALVHIIVHIHIFLAGYLFTISLIYIDPTPHRTSLLYRTIIFVLALVGHSILSKYIYAYPPKGVVIEEAEIGGMLMYYGGEVIDIFIIFILYFQWYKETKPSNN